jgi:hypothetical protein
MHECIIHERIFVLVQCPKTALSGHLTRKLVFTKVVERSILHHEMVSLDILV